MLQFQIEILYIDIKVKVEEKMKKFVSILLFILLVISMPGNRILAGSFKAKLIILLLKANIFTLKSDISKMESKAFGVKNNKRKLEKIQEEIEKIKQEYGIKKLQQEQLLFEKNKDKIAEKVYDEAIFRGENLFSQLNILVKEIQNNPIIQDLVEEIIKLKRKILERSKKDIDKIQELGKQIDKVTQEAQAELNSVKSKILPLEQQIRTIWLSREVAQKRAPLIREKIEVLEEIERSVDERLPTQDKNTLHTLKNLINRYELLLDYFRNPNKVQAATEEEMFGFSKYTSD